MCTRDSFDSGSGGDTNVKDCDGGGRRDSKSSTTNGTRIRDRNGYRQRAAAFCARLVPAKKGDEVAAIKQWPPKLAGLEVLLVSARTGDESYWVLPGGGVENMESTEEAAVRELHEEAGVLGKVLFYIGEFNDEKRLHHTTLYFLTVLEIFTEWSENRQRRWMRMEEARQNIKHNQLDMLEQSIKIIESTLGDRLQPAVSTSLLAIPIVSPRAGPELGGQYSRNNNGTGQNANHKVSSTTINGTGHHPPPHNHYHPMGKDSTHQGVPPTN